MLSVGCQIYRMRGENMYCLNVSLYHILTTVWHFCKISDIKKIENIQKRDLRYIIKDYSSTYTELRNMACKPLLCVYRIKLIIIEIFKIIHKIGPTYLLELFARKEYIHNFRGSFRVTMPKFRTIQYGKHSLRYEWAQMWNQLDDDIKRAINLKVFRRRIKKWKGPNCSCFNCTLILLVYVLPNWNKVLSYLILFYLFELINLSILLIPSRIVSISVAKENLK